MNRYWRGLTKDGKFVTEAQGTRWEDVKSEIKKLEFVMEDKDIVIRIPEAEEYVQAKTCSADLSTGQCEIESRYIGFKLGNNIIQARVDEKSGNIILEVITCQ